jgi:hypothetical protein
MMRHPVGIIERAFELARRSANVEEIRAQLRREGYFDVDAHLIGRKIRSDLVKIIRATAQIQPALS